MSKCRNEAEFQNYLQLARGLGADDELEARLIAQWKKLSGTTFMNDPVHGSRSAVIFDNRGDMGGGKSAAAAVGTFWGPHQTDPTAGGGKSAAAAVGTFWGPHQTDPTAGGGKSAYSPPYSRGKPSKAHMERTTANHGYQELHSKLSDAESSIAHITRMNDDLNTKCKDLEDENQRYQEAIRRDRQHLVTERKNNERNVQRLITQSTEIEHLKSEIERLERENERLERENEAFVEYQIRAMSITS